MDDDELQTLISDAYDLAKLCRVFACAEPPEYDLALMELEYLIPTLEDMREEFKARRAAKSSPDIANPS